MSTEPFHTETPLIKSEKLSKLSDLDVYLKLDSLQPAGSFKIRGIGLMVQKAYAAGKRLFVCSSAGNAGIAAAYACKCLGVKLKVVVPSNTMQMMRNLMAEQGAEVVERGEVWDEANQYALQLQQTEGAFYVPPFDHEDIWEGNSSVVEEIYNQIHTKPGAIMLAVGGGGLLQGVVQGLDKVGWGSVPIIAVETFGAHSYYTAVQAKELVSLPQITSIARTLCVRRVSQTAFESSKTHTIEPLIVTDAMAVKAILLLADAHRLLVEPSCGAAIAPLLNENLGQQVRTLMADPTAPIVVIVCGGNGVSLELLAEWKKQFEA